MATRGDRREACARGTFDPLTDQFGGPLSLLMAIVVILLLLACANIGGLLLARGASRQQEMAVRVSLGAGRLRMVRQVLTESLLLASIGGALGLVGARFGATILTRIMTSGTQSLGPSPRLEILLDARVLTFTIGVTLLAALVFGSRPLSRRSCPRRRRRCDRGRSTDEIPTRLRQRPGGRAGRDLPGAVERVAALHRPPASSARPKSRVRSRPRAADVGEHLARPEPRATRCAL